MTRLFDSDAEAKKYAAAREAQQEARRRGDAVEEALKDFEETDAQSKAISASLNKARAGVVPIFYQEHREPGSGWMIEHSPSGEDYIFQIHPLRPLKMVWQDIILQMIAAVDVIYPESVRKEYSKPNETYQMKFYTVKLCKVVGLPGWKGAVERTLAGLSAVDAWQSSKQL